MSNRLMLRLLFILRDHGHPCRINANGTLSVASRGVVVSTGKAKWSTENIPATSAAVYEWLGY